jgi:hypothetical protein
MEFLRQNWIIHSRGFVCVTRARGEVKVETRVFGVDRRG